MLVYIGERYFTRENEKRGRSKQSREMDVLDLGNRTELFWNNYWNWTGQLMELDGPANSAT